MAEDEYRGMPRWVKVVAILGVIALILAIAAALLGGVEHGPSRHTPAHVGGAALLALAEGSAA